MVHEASDASFSLGVEVTKIDMKQRYKRTTHLCETGPGELRSQNESER